ncbi:MAG: hypothetical protein QUS33_04745 [Dehalococcoidia bacterium]|nr:hypothetical protein [Dehalococcoidia bacterium]
MRETCKDYEPYSLQELLDRDRFVRSVLVGHCPRCSGDNTYDCENNPSLNDATVGHCLDCDAYWCLLCAHEFDSVGKGTQCPHWAVCYECSLEHGYLDEIEFIQQICLTCPYYDNGCLLDDPSACEWEGEYLCPYADDVSACPKIQEKITGTK